MFFQILGSIAEFEHALRSERTHDGLAAARARGRTGGQKPRLTPRQAKSAQQMYEEAGPDGHRVHTVEQIAAGVRPHPSIDFRQDYGFLHRGSALSRATAAVAPEPQPGGLDDPRSARGGYRPYLGCIPTWRSTVSMLGWDPVTLLRRTTGRTAVNPAESAELLRRARRALALGRNGAGVRPPRPPSAGGRQRRSWSRCDGGRRGRGRRRG